MEHLTEPGIRQYFVDSFKTCKEYKLQYHTWLLNIGLLAFFTLIVAGILYYKYKGKQSPQLKKKKNEEDRVFIMNRIRSLQIEKQKDNNQLITNLPF
jgi:cell division protein YceG involved in septum cleavage